MHNYADLAVYNKSGQLTLIVEIKNKLGTSTDWAVQLRRNMYAHDSIPAAPFFLLALPDHFYLWMHQASSPEDARPSHEADPILFLKPYFDKSGILLSQVTGQSFELIVISWLNQILQARTSDDIQNQVWVINSGLFNALSGGYLYSQPAVA